jgi:hypothetical protein
LELIRRDLHEDAYARQRENPRPYTGKNLAESIETALYMCPRCKRIGAIQSRGDRLFCACGLDMCYTEYGMLESRGEEAERFSTVTDWDLWQQDMTEALVFRAEGGIIAEDTALSLYEVTPCKSSALLHTGTLSITAEALACGDFQFPLNEISDLAIVDRNTLVFETISGGYYEIKSKSAYSALKYRRIFLYCKTNGTP